MLRGRQMNESVKIVLLSILASVVYGILHDLVTAHVCVEYFTVFHPRIIASQDPNAMALLWGVIATWWMGLIFGLILAGAPRMGQSPKLEARELVMPITVLLAITAVCAFLAGVMGSTVHEWFPIPRVPIQGVDPSRFNTCLFSHNASYFVSGIGTLVLCVFLNIVRTRRARPV
jgi:hypothetical protein